MKQHTQEFKNKIKEMGRQISTKLIYNDNILEQELYSANIYYDGNILKSIMKTLEVESSVEIPLNEVVNFQFGILVDENYEYLDYGNYVVYNIEKQEDLQTYKITFYDKMLYSMKPYENMGIIYPITIRDYISTICNHLEIGFANRGETFANWNKVIPNEKYLDTNGNNLGYTFRDVLDELAEVTGSTICINENDELEIRYINETNDTINENYLKDSNITFGEKYGPVNSIVLSRSGGADNVYINDQQSIEENGLCEIKITDNQIMNDNNRSEYLPDLLSRLGGLEYYINNFSSTGICYYDICDKYSVQVDEQSYSCVMFNDEINIEEGIEELIYTDMPEQSETDYEKSDKTDMKINQTYLIVDKQNQVIESVISNVTEQNNKISQITQTVDEINTKIQDFADITISGETSYAKVELDNINESEPITVIIHPININISYLYPNINLFPSPSQFLPVRTLRFKNITTNEIFDYELPDDLLYYDSENYDEFYLSYDSQTCQITKRCKYNADGSISLLDNEIVNSYSYPTIELTDGDYEISLLGYEYGYLSIRLMASNIYTSQFATQVEVKSQIQQTAQSIDLSVNQKLSNYSTTTEMNSAITIKANEITSTVSNTYETKTSAQQNYSQLRQTDSQITSTVSNKVGKNEVISRINQTAESIKINANKLGLSANNVIDILAGNTINLTSKSIVLDSEYFKVTKYGQVSASNLTITGGSIVLNSPDYNSGIRTSDGYNWSSLYNGGVMTTGLITSGNGDIQTVIGNGTGSFQKGGSDYTIINGGIIEAISYNYHSLEKFKENIEKVNFKALELIENSDIYEFNYKAVKGNKKNYGFIIGKNYKTPKEVISENGDGINSYSMISILWKAVQEQQEEIKELRKEIEKLKEEKTNE